MRLIHVRFQDKLMHLYGYVTVRWNFPLCLCVTHSSEVFKLCLFCVVSYYLSALVASFIRQLCYQG